MTRPILKNITKNNNVNDYILGIYTHTIFLISPGFMVHNLLNPYYTVLEHITLV